MSAVDRWAVMALQLAGEPVPSLPQIAGQRHEAPTISRADPHADAWEAENGPVPSSGKGRRRSVSTARPRAITASGIAVTRVQLVMAAMARAMRHGISEPEAGSVWPHLIDEMRHQGLEPVETMPGLQIEFAGGQTLAKISMQNLLSRARKQMQSQAGRRLF